MSRVPAGKLWAGFWTLGPMLVWSHLCLRMHWVPKDRKFYYMRLNVDIRSTMEIGGEATDIAPHRTAFIKATLEQWEQEWLEEEGKKP
jgi:hypothetical protein